MPGPASLRALVLRHGDADIFDLIDGIRAGDPLMLMAVGVILGCIAFFFIYEKLTGRSFVKSKKERRRAKERRMNVIWKYERDD